MTVVAGTSAMLAVLDGSERWHGAVQALYAAHRLGWLLPAPSQWSGAAPPMLPRAGELLRRHRALRLGWADAMVMASAERLRADAIATLDYRHFAPVALRRRIPLLRGGDA